MLQRLVKNELENRLEVSPAVALIGPRQCGKTTLARSYGGVYFDLEQQSDRLKLDLEWNNLVTRERLLILDEAQSWPEVFNRLRGSIDGNADGHGPVV